MYDRLNRSVNWVAVAFGFSVATLLSGAEAQGAVLHAQPWDRETDPFPSQIAYCSDASPSDHFYWDDWRATSDSTVRAVRWWGHLTSDEAIQNPDALYCIRIATQDPSVCRPDDIVYLAEVRPKFYYVRNDCRQNEIFSFVAPLPGGFEQKEETKYWISIAEINTESATSEVDFEWSGRLPTRRCRAVGQDGTGSFTGPPISVCHDERVGLSFVLFGS